MQRINILNSTAFLRHHILVFIILPLLLDCSPFSPIQSPKIKKGLFVDCYTYYTDKRLEYQNLTSINNQEQNIKFSIFPLGVNARAAYGFSNIFEISGSCIPLIIENELDLGIKLKLLNSGNNDHLFANMAASFFSQGTVNAWLWDNPCLPCEANASCGLIFGTENKNNTEIVIQPAVSFYSYGYPLDGKNDIFHNDTATTLESNVYSVDMGLGFMKKLDKFVDIKIGFIYRYPIKIKKIRLNNPGGSEKDENIIFHQNFFFQVGVVGRL
jgi:hypothetical protein